jgi:hypothetical protein
VLILCPKFTKTHLRASLVQKNFFRLANARHKRKGREGGREGRGGEGRGGRGGEGREGGAVPHHFLKRCDAPGSCSTEFVKTSVFF